MHVGQRIKQRREELNMSAEELGIKIGKAKTTIYRYELGLIEKMPTSTLKDIATALYTTPAYLMGWEEEQPTKEQNFDIFQIKNISPIATKKVPMLGDIACGQPIFAAEEHGYYVEVNTDINADFCLTARGDSMIGARIQDGDIVFCKSQSMVNNGEIAVVIIGEEATLKRVYYNQEQQKLILQAENPKYEPFVYIGEELQDVHIIGKAIALHTEIR